MDSSKRSRNIILLIFLAFALVALAVTVKNINLNKTIHVSEGYLNEISPVKFSSPATAIYVANYSAGANNGADCSDAHSTPWFNNAANWGTGSGQIGPGTTVYICGIITSSVKGGVALNIQGSGTASNPITIFFEPGAVLESTGWWGNDANGAGAITISGYNFITIDGGEERNNREHVCRHEWEHLSWRNLQCSTLAQWQDRW